MKTIKKIKKAQTGTKFVKPSADSTKYYQNVQTEAYQSAARNMNFPKYSDQAFKRAAQAGKDIDRQSKKGKPGYDKDGFPIKKQKSGGKVTKAKAGKQMLKRADGSYSQRGLWDNIRANKGSGKKPTKAMLQQEKKIKSQTKKK